MIEPGAVNLGIAVDVERKDGSRSLMVPCIKGADALDFAGFHSYYEELITKTRENKLTADDFQGTNISLTNPGGLGTVASVPRLMTGPGHDRRHRLDRLPGRVGPRAGREDQGARRLEGHDDDLDLRPPHHPGRGVGLVPAPDRRAAAGRGRLLRVGRASRSGSPADVDRQRLPGLRLGPAAARRRAAAAPAAAPPDTELLQAVQAATSLLKAYRTHGHLAARLDPLGSEPKGDPAIQPENLNLTPELMSQIPASILRIGVEGETLLEALPRMREAYCGTIAYQIEHLSSHQQRMWLRDMIETGAHRKPLDRRREARAAQRG